MKSYKILALGAAISSVLLAASFQANAATSIEVQTVSNSVTDPATPDATITLTGLRTEGWASPTMSYKGWTHHSGWLMIDAQKGKVVTITVDGSSLTGFHPGLTVWYRNTALKSDNEKIHWMDDHFYFQGKSINVPNAKSDNDQNALPKDAVVGNIKMDYITSAFDSDGLGDMITSGSNTYGPYLPFPYLDALVGSKGISGGSSDKGKLSVTFTAPKTGVYQVAVGGLKPDVGSTAAVKASCSVTLPAGTTLNQANCEAATPTAGVYTPNATVNAAVNVTIN